MKIEKRIIKEINEISSLLIENGICDKYHSPSSHLKNGKIFINWENCHDISVALKNLDYDSIYKELSNNSQYNYMLADGTMLQLLYEVENNTIASHRLAAFPSRHLESFQNDSELYEIECVYADILSKSTVTFPLRFDYSKECIPNHPKSHLSLGQYKNCRIPVYGPIMPKEFVKFVLKNFYNTFFEEKIINKLDSRYSIDYTISELEKSEMHLNLKRSGL